MSNFDEWFKDYHNKHEAYAETISSDAYKAGAASRQAEIDSLKIELNGANERAMMTLNHKNKMVDKMQAEIDALKQEVMREREQGTEFFTDCENMKAERDALQKRIDEALRELKVYKDSKAAIIALEKDK